MVLLSGLRAGEVESLLERLRALEAPPTLGSAEALARLAAHVHRHRELLWYDEARKRGLGVGTGIAENGVGERRQFLAQAKGSTAELQAQLHVPLDVGYMDQKTYDLHRQTRDVQNLHGGSRRDLSTRTLRGSKYPKPVRTTD